MAFALIKWYARFCFLIYCRKLIVTRAEWLHSKGPILFAANHPNSFLDGIILTTLAKHRVYSLARGDAFQKIHFEKILRWFNLLPVYRTSEGVENLAHNYTTFAACEEVFKKQESVLIFSEGSCINEWHLRPLRKGTARLALRAWENGIDLTVIPLGYNYSSFRSIGKTIHLHLGTPINKQLVLEQATEGKQLVQFNGLLQAQLEQLVYEFPANGEKHAATFLSPLPFFIRLLFTPVALAGAALHAPLYFLMKKITGTYFDNDHFDSVFTALLMLGYLLYWPLLTFCAFLFGGMPLALTFFIFLPFSAWVYNQVK